MDNCCFNRPFDDPAVLLNRLEAEAKTHIQSQILVGVYELAWSYILDYENAANPFEHRRNAIARWKHRAMIDVVDDADIVRCAGDVARCCLRNKDALHVACALRADCHYFLTTDKGILKKKVGGIALANPLDFIREVESLP